MAESLEGSRDMDCDRRMDSLGYSREQFDRFIHDYRESAEPSTYDSHESDTAIDAALKKDFINVERRLTKTFYVIKKLPKAETSNGLCLRIESMLEIFKTLKIVKEDNKEEFSLHNVPLPDYDAADIELLLGKDFASTQITHNNGLSKFKEKLRKQIIGNIQMAKILLEECDETVSLYREKGGCFERNSYEPCRKSFFKICDSNGCRGFFARIITGNQGISSIRRIHSSLIFSRWPPTGATTWRAHLMEFRIKSCIIVYFLT